jgi:hypothetical protein
VASFASEYFGVLVGKVWAEMLAASKVMLSSKMPVDTGRMVSFENYYPRESDMCQHMARLDSEMRFGGLLGLLCRDCFGLESNFRSMHRQR